jgi:hypothetical protein
MFKGQVIDKAVKQAVEDDPSLSNISIPKQGVYGPDFYDSSTKQWWDVTTEKNWPVHDKYTAQYGSGTKIIY